MDLYCLFKDFGGHVMAGLGIVGGIYGYFRHDRKLKEQEKRLNDLQIKRFEKEEAQEKMAEIRASIIHGSRGTSKIRFVNVGKSNAYNVRIEILTSEKEMEGVVLSDEWGPYDMINPQMYREERIALCIGCPDIISLNVIWDDAYGKNRKVKLDVPL